MIRRAKRTLAIVALTTLVGCRSTIVPTTTAQTDVVLRLYHPPSMTAFVHDVTAQYHQIFPNIRFETSTANYEQLVNQSQTNEDSFYFLSQHFEQQDSLWAAPIGQEGIVLMTHPDNTVNDLSTTQLNQIFGGNITNWESLKGDDLPIIVLTRESGSGLYENFNRLVMGQRDITPNAEVLVSSSAILERVRQTEGAIAYINLSEVDESVQVVAVNGITPTLDSLIDNTYPLRSTVYIVGTQEPMDEYRAFIGWLQGKEGQAFVMQYFAPIP